MAGSNQSVNLQGMLGDIAGVVGDMGSAYEFVPDTIRQISRPDMDMNDPNKMKAYGMWLARNGNEAEGAQMMQAAAARQQQLKMLEGEKKIMELSAGWSEMLPSQRANREKAIAAIAQQYEVSPLKVADMLEKNRQAERKLDATDQSIADQMTVALMRDATDQRGQDVQLDIAEGNNSTALAINNNDNQTVRRGQDLEWRMASERLAEQVRSNLAQESLTGRDLTRKENELAENARQFGLNLDLEQDRLAETARFNDARIYGIENDVAQGWKGLQQEDARIEISKALADEKITMGQFERLIMGDENRRAEDMHPVNRALKEAQIKVATAQAGFTEAQTSDLLYDLGFKRDTESLRVDAMELENELTEANVVYRKAQTAYTEENTDLVAEKVKTERANTGHVKALTKSVTAAIEREDTRLEMDQALNEFTMEFKERQQGWDMGMDQLRMQLEQQRIESGIQLDQAQIRNIDNTIRSSVFRDELTMASMLANQVTETAVIAYSMPIDVLNPTAVANARQMFVQQYGAQAAYDFDTAMSQRIELKRLELDTSAMALNLENARPVTRERLAASGMPEQRIDQVMATNDPTTRNNMIQAWAKDANTPEKGGGLMTEETIAFYADIAEDIQKDIFGSGILWTGAFNKVWDGDVRKDIALAMANAAAAGKSIQEQYIAGVNATYKYQREAGSQNAARATATWKARYGEE